MIAVSREKSKKIYCSYKNAVKDAAWRAPLLHWNTVLLWLTLHTSNGFCRCSFLAHWTWIWKDMRIKPSCHPLRRDSERGSNPEKSRKERTYDIIWASESSHTWSQTISWTSVTNSLTILLPVWARVSTTCAGWMVKAVQWSGGSGD